jgi:hypothetical protein
LYLHQSSWVLLLQIQFGSPSLSFKCSKKEEEDLSKKKKEEEQKKKKKKNRTKQDADM